MKKCDQKGTKRAVATKFVNKKLMKRDQVTHELGILQNLQHPLLVGLLDTFETPTSYVLVLEMCVHALPPPAPPGPQPRPPGPQLPLPLDPNSPSLWLPGPSSPWTLAPPPPGPQPPPPDP